jgi:hypothetical protein
MTEETRPGGRGAAFEVTDMPPPPDTRNLKSLLKIMGPAVIALGGAIGGGEWLIGPSLFVKWGLGLLWVTLVSALLQTYLNLEMCRYTLYTGEPIIIGYMRLAPGKIFWGWLFTIVGFLERALPGWALGAGTAIAAFQLSRIPGAADKALVINWGIFVFAACVILILFGRTIERMLEWANWIMMAVVLGGLLLLDLYIVPGSVWLEGVTGFFKIGWIPTGVDVLLLGALVGYSAYGGFGNNAITNWYRDKGYGMGGLVGHIPSAIGGQRVEVSHVGRVPRDTTQNRESWKGWWRILNIDQWWLFFGGALIGMFLPGILYVASLPRGQTLPAWGIAASSASGLVNSLGNFGWFLALFFGFWILFSTALSNVDLVVRQSTDILWSSTGWVRRLCGADIRKVYYPILFCFLAWGVAFVNITLPLVIFAVSANIANFTMSLSSVLTMILNRKFVPKEYRGSLFREIMLLVCTLFFGFFFIVFLFHSGGLSKALAAK